MTLIVPILIVLALLQLLIGISILFQSRKSKQTHQKIFVVLLTVLFFWTIASMLLVYVDSDATALNIGYFNIVNAISYFVGAATIVLVYLFGLYYPVHRTLSRYRRIVLATGTAITLLAPFPFVSGAFTFNSGTLAYHYGSLSLLFVVYALVVLISLFADSVLLYRSAVERGLKLQATTVLLGLTFTVVHALVFLIVLPSAVGNNPIFYGVGYLAPYYYTGLTAYSLLRQGLFDVRTAIIRSVAYVASLTAMAVSAGIVLLLLSFFFFGGGIEMRQAFILSAAGAALAILFQPFVRVFNRFTSRLFYRDAYSPQTFIDELNKILVSTIQLEEIVEQSSALIAATMRTDLCVFSLYASSGRPVMVGKVHKDLNGHERTMMKDYFMHSSEQFILVSELDHDNQALKKMLEVKGVDFVIPLIDKKHDAEIMGFIMLAEKKSGSLYNRQDIRILTIVANELVIAIQNALRFKEIQSFNLTLQQKVDDATRLLRHSNEKLRKLDETKDDFISMASHQLRTPLTSVKGYVSMVLDGDAGKITALQRKLLSQSFISSQRMVYLISDLLNVSRLRTGKFIIESLPTNLARVIQEEIEQLGDTAKGRGLELTFHKPEHFPTLMLDETKMRQVIMNFVDNAVYYTPTGGHIDVYLVDRPNSIEFTVVDDGIGVPRQDQHHLFTKFFRAHNAKRARPDGTGLGLFMAKKVVVAQGGAVIFKSQEGKGSTFGFTFAKAKLLPPEKAKPNAAPAVRA